MTSSSGQEMWGLWEHDKYEPDLYVRHRKDADGCEHTDSLGLDYLNALEAAAQALREQLRLAHIDAMNEAAENAALRTRVEALEGALREIHEMTQGNDVGTVLDRVCWLSSPKALASLPQPAQKQEVGE